MTGIFGRYYELPQVYWRRRSEFKIRRDFEDFDSLALDNIHSSG